MENESDINKVCEFVKVDSEQRIVWGWAYVVKENGETVYDAHGDSISPEEMSKAADEFMTDIRAAKAMHQGDSVGEVIHSFPLTKELGEALGVSSNREGWIIAMKIKNDDIWEKVKSGKYAAFSIGGRAMRHAV